MRTSEHPPLTTVCFDLDGTLCLSNQSDEDVHRAVFDRVGVDPFFTPQDVRAVDSADVATAESDGQFYENLYRATVEQLTRPVDVDDSLLRTLGEITTDVVDETDVSFREGAQDALAHATKHYDDVGLITNGGPETQRAKLETLGIEEAFDVTVFCDPVSGVDPKPARKPFEVALEGLSSAPETTVYVGDSYSADVVGAHEAGLRSLWVPVPERLQHQTVPANPDPAPTYRVDSMTELSSVL